MGQKKEKKEYEKERIEKSKTKKVVSHLKGDIKTFKSEAQEDKELIKKLKRKK